PPELSRIESGMVVEGEGLGDGSVYGSTGTSLVVLQMVFLKGHPHPQLVGPTNIEANKGVTFPEKCLPFLTMKEKTLLVKAVTRK
ncbi:hypothetical protein Tco_0303758, partial [Tanacetum coccineum]